MHWLHHRCYMLYIYTYTYSNRLRADWNFLENHRPEVTTFNFKSFWKNQLETVFKLHGGIFIMLFVWILKKFQYWPCSFRSIHVKVCSMSFFCSIINVEKWNSWFWHSDAFLVKKRVSRTLVNQNLATYTYCQYIEDTSLP